MKYLENYKHFIVGGVVLIAAVFAYFFLASNSDTQVSPAPNISPQQISATPSPDKPDIEIVAENLEIPWEIAFLPNGDFLVTERPGRLIRIGQNNQTYEIEGVRHVGEGGLLGLALDPNFESNNYLYLYLTSSEDGSTVNRVERYTLLNNNLTERNVILDGIEGASNHDGGRIVFGPDGYLYVTTGDAGNTQLSQDRSSLNGKILRINADGSIPEDNPYENEVYSWGHRNVQGLAWDNQGRLWVTEHGRSGIRSGLDELNLIHAGANYGWPAIQGDETQDGMVMPVVHSGGNTWAPSGAVFYNESIFFAGLRGRSLYEAVLEGENVTEIKQHFEGEYGRLRTVTLGPDGYFYVLTSNRDGRGMISDGDDKIIRVNPEILN